MGSPAATPAFAEVNTGAEQQFVELINHERTSRGLVALTVAPDVRAVARSWSARMASERSFYHNPRFSQEICCWSLVTENIAWWTSTSVSASEKVAVLHDGLMNSPGHRANILDERVTEVGVGVWYGEIDGSPAMYVTQNFRRPDSTAPPPEEMSDPESAPSVPPAQPTPDPPRTPDPAPHDEAEGASPATTRPTPAPVSRRAPDPSGGGDRPQPIRTDDEPEASEGPAREPRSERVLEWRLDLLIAAIPVPDSFESGADTVRRAELTALVALAEARNRRGPSVDFYFDALGRTNSHGYYVRASTRQPLPGNEPAEHVRMDEVDKHVKPLMQPGHVRN